MNFVKREENYKIYSNFDVDAQRGLENPNKIPDLQRNNRSLQKL